MNYDELNAEVRRLQVRAQQTETAQAVVDRAAVVVSEYAAQRARVEAARASVVQQAQAEARAQRWKRAAKSWRTTAEARPIIWARRYEELDTRLSAELNEVGAALLVAEQQRDDLLDRLNALVMPDEYHRHPQARADAIVARVQALQAKLGDMLADVRQAVKTIDPTAPVEHTHAQAREALRNSLIAREVLISALGDDARDLICGHRDPFGQSCTQPPFHGGFHGCYTPNGYVTWPFVSPEAELQSTPIAFNPLTYSGILADAGTLNDDWRSAAYRERVRMARQTQVCGAKEPRSGTLCELPAHHVGPHQAGDAMILQIEWDSLEDSRGA